VSVPAVHSPHVLTSACASLIHQAFHHSGAQADMDLILYRAFLDAGLPMPNMRMDLPIGGDPDFTALIDQRPLASTRRLV
jgi:hypothetical protein